MSKGRLAGAAVALALMGAVAAGCTTASQARRGGRYPQAAAARPGSDPTARP